MTARQRLALLGAAAILIACGGVALSSTDLLAARAAVKRSDVVLLSNRYISFGGFLWQVRDSNGTSQLPSGGPWSASPDNAWVDSKGALHLKVTVVNGKRISAQLASVTPFSYGTYTWRVRLNPNKLDIYTVLGLFTYGPNTRGTAPNELDIEHGKFFSERKDGTASQFVVQPYHPTGHLHRFGVPNSAVDRIEQIVWQPRRVDFTVTNALEPHAPAIAKWTFSTPTEVPVFYGDRLCMNYWSYQPAKGRPLKPPVDEVVIESFSFTPKIPLGLSAIPATSTQ